MTIVEPRILTYYKFVVCQDILYACRLKNIMELPKIVQCVLNTSSSQVIKDKTRALPGQTALQLLSGQKSKATRSKKSVASFQLRRGSLLGCHVKLRGKALYSFLDQYVTIVSTLYISAKPPLTIPKLPVSLGGFKPVNRGAPTDDTLALEEKGSTIHFADANESTGKSAWHKAGSFDYNFGENTFTFFPGLDNHFLLLSNAGGFNCTLSISKSQSKRAANYSQTGFIRCTAHRLLLLLTALQYPIMSGK